VWILTFLLLRCVPIIFRPAVSFLAVVLRCLVRPGSSFPPLFFKPHKPSLSCQAPRPFLSLIMRHPPGDFSPSAVLRPTVGSLPSARSPPSGALFRWPTIRLLGLVSPFWWLLFFKSTSCLVLIGCVPATFFWLLSYEAVDRPF